MDEQKKLAPSSSKTSTALEEFLAFKASLQTSYVGGSATSTPQAAGQHITIIGNLHKAVVQPSQDLTSQMNPEDSTVPISSYQDPFTVTDHTCGLSSIATVPNATAIS